MAACGNCGPRIINAWASKKVCGPLEMFQYESPALGPFGVEIKVKYCGLCGSDLHLINADGGYKDFTAYEKDEPQICGHEVVGVVTGLGSDLRRTTI